MAASTGGRGNALRRQLGVSVAMRSRASAEAIYDVLADVRTHLDWGGERQSETSRLISIEAQPGLASVGTEFRTTGRDPMGTFRDSSVVTEATRPEVFEFVTESLLETKRGASVEWTNVHRYELRPDGDGAAVRYSVRIVRASQLPGALRAMRMPVLSGLVMRAARGPAARGLRNLVALAEERQATSARS